MQPLLNKSYENLKLATILCDPFSLWAIRKKNFVIEIFFIKPFRTIL